MDKLEERHYLNVAKGLAVGEVVKIVHAGCGNRPALHIANEADRWWAYCHKCRRSGSVSKTLQRIKVKAPDKTGWVPDALYPAQDYIHKLILNDHLPEWVWEHITILKYAPDTQRIYVPDASNSLWGYDGTGAATARLYSPYKKPMAVIDRQGNATLFITSSIRRYLGIVREGCSAVLVGGAAAYDPTVALVSATDKDVVIDSRANFHPVFIRNLKQFGANLNHGG